MSRAVVVGLALLAATGVAWAADTRTTLEATTSVPVEQDACLDHTVKELGMSAKRKDKERVWAIGPQFVHPSLLPDGTVRVELAREAERSSIKVALAWSGPLKERAVEAEIEARVTAMAAKMAQMCGVLQAPVRCVTSTGGGPATACQHAR